MRDTKTEKNTISEFKHALTEHSSDKGLPYKTPLGKMLFVMRLEAARNPDQNTLDDAAVAFWTASDLQGRAAYVEIRDLMRKALRNMATRQIEYKRAMRQRGGNPDAQQALFEWRPEITMLIALRRAGKRWSAAKAASSDV